MDDELRDDLCSRGRRQRAKCRECRWLNWDFVTDGYERGSEPFCGLHGRARVDPSGKQPNLDHMGGCGFVTKYEQLKLFE